MNWQYHINYGPDGEANYANLTTPEGEHVANIRTRHAMRIVTELTEARAQIAAKDAALRRIVDFVKSSAMRPYNMTERIEKIVDAALAAKARETSK